MRYFRSEEEFWDSFQKFNILYGDWLGWKEADARKLHEDSFGELIKKGETYFSLETGRGYDSVEKLSMSSMEKLLYFVMKKNPGLTQLAERLLKEEGEKRAEAANRLNSAAIQQRERRP